MRGRGLEPLAMDPSTQRELAAALKHDLGKYVAWRSANLAEDAWTGPVGPMLIESLQADVLRTRETQSGARAAWELWDELTSSIPRPLQAEELKTVERAIEVLRGAAEALTAGTPETVGPVRTAIRDAQSSIRGALRDYHRRLLREA
jgi:hypothetical protein